VRIPVGKVGAVQLRQERSIARYYGQGKKGAELPQKNPKGAARQVGRGEDPVKYGFIA